jgi:hypothetical protein
MTVNETGLQLCCTLRWDAAVCSAPEITTPRLSGSAVVNSGGREPARPVTCAGGLPSAASRTGMWELVVRSLVHRAARGHDGAALLVAGVDNPQLVAFLP